MNERDVALSVLHKFHKAISSDRLDEPENIGVPHVTGMVYECQRKCYYAISEKNNSMNKSGAIRVWIGRELHKTNFLGGEIELNLVWENNGEKIIQGTLDELSLDHTILLDKKTTRSTPRDAYPHHRKQVEIYNLMLSKMRGYSASWGVILYINVENTDVFPSVWKFEKKNLYKLEQEILEKHRVIKRALKSGVLPPRIIQPWSSRNILNTVCDYCDSYGRCWSEDRIDFKR